MKLGVSGGMGSGKSSVCLILSALGARVFDSYSAAKALYQESEMKKRVIDLLGPEVYQGDRIDPVRMSAVLFSKPDLLGELESLVHPIVRARWELFAENALAEGRWAVMESALMFERGRPSGFDFTLWVSAPEPLRIKRVMSRSGLSEAQVLERIRRQKNESQLMPLADGVIVNDGRQPLLPQVYALWNRLRNQG